MFWTAKAAFGLEGFVKRDLMRLGLEDIKTEKNGTVSFSGSAADAFRANMWLRCADRVMLKAVSFKAMSFEELFEGVYAFPWGDIIPSDGAFPVKARCARSKLMSPRDCQSIVKKAIAKRLADKYRRDILPENGAQYQVEVSIHSDTAVIALDSSGIALNRRGWRDLNGEAAIRETLAAALLFASEWNPRKSLIDPCCGTGTIPIEAAFIALDRAPGLKRDFAIEKWNMLSPKDIKDIRSQAAERFIEGKKRKCSIMAYDIDPMAVSQARHHISKAGLDGIIRVETLDMRDLDIASGESGVYVANPPYGERMADIKAARAVARALGELLRRSPGWNMTVITSDMGFEKAFGARAVKKRSFYNARLECQALNF